VQFATDLRQLRNEAGAPPYRQLAERAHYSSAALAAAANGRRLPSLGVTLAYVRACGGDVAAWESRWHALATDLATADQNGASSPDDPASPYVGLAPFQSTDAGRFFGREQLVANMLRRVERHRFVAVFGASGSGKSSVLRAGLVPQWTARSPTSVTAVFTPGPHPLEECALRLAALCAARPADLLRQLGEDRRALHWIVRQIVEERSADTDVLIVVDQFEEAFTLCADNDERTRFIEVLVTAAAAGNGRCHIVIGTRADFYEHCTAHADLVHAFDDAQLAVGPMTMDELRRAITQPALQQHLVLEGALLVELVANTYGRIGVLPLLSHALLETWRRRRGNTLTLAGFQATGGIDGALANTAESAYRALSAHRQEVAASLFTRLAALGAGTQDTKRRIRRDDVDLTDDDVRAVVEHFVGARLVTVDQDRIEITHEALIRCWPRLRRWLTEDRDVLRWHHELTEASHQWEEIGRDQAALLRGVRLATANDWVARGSVTLTSREQSFLDASSALQTFERAAARRQNRRLRRLVAVLTVLLVLAAGTTTYAGLARQAAARQRDIATAQNVADAAQVLRPTQPALANQLLLAAYRLAPTSNVRNALLGAFVPPYATVVDSAESVVAMAAPADGRLLASAGSGGSLYLTDVTDPHRPKRVAADHDGTRRVDALAFSADGTVLAGGDRDGTVLWDTADPAHWRPGRRVGPAGLPVLAVAVSPDGTRLAAAGADRSVRLWDITGTGPPRPTAVLIGDTGTVRAVAFSPDGHTIATAGDDRALRLWAVSDGAPARLRSVLPLDHPLSTVVFSPDGRLVAAAGGDNTVLLWSLTNTGELGGRVILTGHTDTVTAVAFSPDSHVLASGSVDATVRLWDVRDAGHAGPLLTLGGHIDTVTAISFSHGGQTLTSASRDRTMRLWDVPGNVLAAHGSSVYSVAASPNGRTVATASYDRTVRLWDVRDVDHPHPQGVLTEHSGPVNAAAFRPDGRVLATAGDDGTARLWDVVDPDHPRQLSVPVHGATAVHAVAFSPDGVTLAVGAADRSVTLLDVKDGARPVHLAAFAGNPDGVWSVAFSPDGRLLAASGEGGEVSMWEIGDRAHPIAIGGLAGHGDAVRSAAFSPRGHLLATAGEDRTVLVWDVTNARRPTSLATLTGYTDGVESVAFSPDGRLLATASSDRTVRLWDVGDRHRIREVATMTGHSKPVDAVTFSRDGRFVITGSEDWTAVLWRVDPEDVARRICEIAYPTITRAEWKRFFQGIAYRPPCPVR
jgi:WD40 repeat protein